MWLLNFLCEISRFGTMVSKESVWKWLTSEEAMSFTEFSYLFLQGYDFLYLFKTMGVNVRTDRSITTGNDLIRKVLQAKRDFGGRFWIPRMNSWGSNLGNTFFELSMGPLGEACSKSDLTAIHDLVEKVGYKDDEGVSTHETLNYKKHGDSAFRSKDFSAAIELYTQLIDGGTMVSPTVFARRSVAYLLTDQPEAALRDAMQAQVIAPGWPLAYYLQAAAFLTLGMGKNSEDMINEGAMIEARKEAQ